MTPLIFAVGAALAAPCDGPTRGLVMEAAADAEQAFRDADPSRIDAAATLAREALPCVGSRLLVEEVGALHRLFAYEAFIGRDLLAAQLWFEASRAADPGYTIPLDVLPQRHPLRGLFDQAAPKARENERVVARRAEVWVDGVATDQAPVGRPALIQQVTSSGVDTVMQAEGGAPPSLDAPAPERSPRGPVVALGASGSVVAGEDQMQGYAGPQARIHVPLTGPLHVEAALSLPLTSGADPAGEGSAWYGLPMAQLGVAARAQSEGPVPWGSAGALLLSDADGLLVGGAAAVGVDLPVGAVAIAPELRGGWAGVPMVGVGVGVALGL